MMPKRGQKAIREWLVRLDSLRYFCFVSRSPNTRQMHPLVVTDLVQFNYTTLPAGYGVEPHLHHYFQLDVILEGRVRVTIEKHAPFHGQAGDAWIIPPLVRHGYDSNQRYRQGSFKFHVACRYWPVFNTSFRRFRARPALLQDLETAGLRQQENQAMATQHAVAVLTLGLIESLADIPAASLRHDRMDSFRHALWPLLERIAEEPRESWSVVALARECHLSTDHFSRCFQSVLGMTPSRYLQETRLRDAAVDLLADPPVSIKEIATRARYATVHAFTRAFTKVFSISPGAYRDSSPEW